MTKTIPADLRKAAKTMAREQGIPHQTALDLLAREAGHPGWGALLASKRSPLDPFRRLIQELWETGGTDLHIEPRRFASGEDADMHRVEGAMTVKDRHLLLMQLSTMLVAGVNVMPALRVLREQHGGRIADAIVRLEAAVSEGGDLADAMFEDSANFPGETGILIISASRNKDGIARALRKAAEHQERILIATEATANDPDGVARPGANVLFRVHGRRRLIRTLDPNAFDALKAAIMPCMTDWSDVRPNEGTVSMEIEGRAHAFPIASFPTDDSTKFVVRVPDRWIAGLSLEGLGIRQLDAWMRICRSGPGIVVVSGKTNSGKSTTIAKTIERLKAEGVDAIAEEANAPFHENRVAEMLEAARTRTVFLEGYGSSLDRAIANAMIMGLGNGGLKEHFLGGVHQQLHMNEVGPRTMDAAVMPWI
jgi:hypothetical protein